MNETGDGDLVIAARSALLDALRALRPYPDAVIVIGAQAIYLHTGAVRVAIAEATKDSDLALDTRNLAAAPLLEDAMQDAGFRLDPKVQQPGTWLNARGIPVDLMVPESLAGGSGRRGARIPPHSKYAARRAAGLEAAVVDHARLEVRALATGDDRANVAGPSALLIAKLHKLGERAAAPGRLVDKDAHDIYRLLVGVSTDQFASTLRRLRSDDMAGRATRQALAFLAELFSAGPDALGCLMAGRAEEGVGNPATVSSSAAILAADLLAALR
jgi:hypothetical protein